MRSYQYHPTSVACTMPKAQRAVVVDMICKNEMKRVVSGVTYTVYQPRHDGWRLVLTKPDQESSLP